MGVDFYCVDDDRVVPLHSFKHAATLQHTLPHNPNPLLIRIDKKAGHGAGKSTVSLEVRDGESEADRGMYRSNVCGSRRISGASSRSRLG